jgi:hypothetical protein
VTEHTEADPPNSHDGGAQGVVHGNLAKLISIPKVAGLDVQRNAQHQGAR